MFLVFWMAWFISASGASELGRDPQILQDRASAMSRVM
jgi:hypothetical protein